MRYAKGIGTVAMLLLAWAAQAADPNSRLVSAAAFGGVNDLKAALAAGANINHRDPKNQGRTPLIMAVISGRRENIVYLIARKANVNARADGGMSALMYVSQMNTFEHKDMIEAARLLLDAKAQVNGTSDEGDTPLMLAVRSGVRDLAALLIRRGASVNMKNKRGRTALMDARVNENAEMMTMLRAAGAVEIPNIDDDLYLAVVHEDAAAAEKAIRGGASVNNRDYAFLYLAAQRGLVSLVTMLLDAKADPNLATDSGETALFAAVGRAQVDLSDVLIRRGADVNVANRKGNTALIAVAQAMAKPDENLALADLLLGAGARPNERGDKGMTALMWAAGQGTPGVTRRIIAAGADVQSADDNQMTALMFAANFSQRESVEALLGAGARINAADAAGWTPLLHAIKGSFDADMTNLLIRAGADVNVRAKGGWTPLMEAAAKGKPEIVKALLAAGADVKARSDEGHTAYRYASMMNVVDSPDSPFRQVVEALRAAGATE